jgi:hypothetical protein
MYVVDNDKNDMRLIKETTFQEQNIKERQHLQEWIAKNPNSLGEELLIIQKEFAGFSDTNERLDLLALDKEKNLVIIENKTDDSGRDVSWQALKYTSYCSGLTTDDIRDIYQMYLNASLDGVRAEEKIAKFYDEEYDEIILNQDLNQRMILVAAKFRKEVTSTVLWLANHNIDIECIKVTPYLYNEDLLVGFEQIIPIKEAEDYTIGIARKSINDSKDNKIIKDREKRRYSFWSQLLPVINEKVPYFQNKTPSYKPYLTVAFVEPGVQIELAITRSETRIDIYINKNTKEENEKSYDKIYAYKDEIETKHKHPVRWQKLEDKTACRIASIIDMTFYDLEVWDELIEIMVDRFVEFHDLMSYYLKK